MYWHGGYDPEPTWKDQLIEAIIIILYIVIYGPLCWIAMGAPWLELLL